MPEVLYRLALPWAKPPLTLNGSQGTTLAAVRAKAACVRRVRAESATLARHSNLPLKVRHATIQLHYRPRDRRHRDPINLTPTQKAVVDGLRDYGLVEDDDPRYVTDLMPEIHAPEAGQPGVLWLTITTKEDPVKLSKILRRPDQIAQRIQAEADELDVQITAPAGRGLIDAFLRRPMPVVVQAGHPVPERAHPADAGLDLTAAESAWIEPGRVVTVGTGVKAQIPDARVGLVCLRSSAARAGLMLPNGVGVIDTGYTGEIRLLLTVLGDEPYRVQAGDRIAQLLVLPILLPTPVRVDQLDATARGEGGFGSTGGLR